MGQFQGVMSPHTPIGSFRISVEPVSSSNLKCSSTLTISRDREGARALQVRRADGLHTYAERADWRVRAHYTLELAHEPDCLQSGARTCGGMHYGPKAE